MTTKQKTLSHAIFFKDEDGNIYIAKEYAKSSHRASLDHFWTPLYFKDLHRIEDPGKIDYYEYFECQRPVSMSPCDDSGVVSMPMVNSGGLGFSEHDLFAKEILPAEKGPTMEDVFEHFGIGDLYAAIPGFDGCTIDKKGEYYELTILGVNDVERTLHNIGIFSRGSAYSSGNKIYVKIKIKPTGSHTKPAIREVSC